MIKHGRESLVRIEGGKYVYKEPLPKRTLLQKRDWLARQHNAAATVQKLLEIDNDAYGVPHVKTIDSKKFYVLEERVNGAPLTPMFFRTLDDKTREKIIDSLAQFYADMHSINIIPNPITYSMDYNLQRLVSLKDFIDSGMGKHLSKSDAKLIEKTYKDLMNASYETRLVFSHCDLCSANVLYDHKTQKINIIDFTDAGTTFLHDDMINTYARDLSVVNPVRARYLKYRDRYYLPTDFTDDARWQKIVQYNNAMSVLEQMDEYLMDFQYLNLEERNGVLKLVKKQVNKLQVLGKIQHAQDLMNNQIPKLCQNMR